MVFLTGDHMKKKFLHGALAVLGLFMVVVVINLFDQKLNPDIETLVQARSSGLETPGLEMYLGLTTKSKNWKEVGAGFKAELQKLETLKSQKAYSEFYHKYKEQTISLDPERGAICKAICTATELQEKQTGIQKYLTEHHELLLRYREFLAVPDVREPAFPHFSLMMVRAGSALPLRDLFHLYLQVNPDHLAPAEIVDLLVKEGQYCLRSLQQKQVSLYQTISLNLLRENARFLHYFVTEHPNAKRLIPSTYIAELRSINAQKIAKNALDGELLIDHELVQLDPDSAGFDSPGSKWASMFFQRNATINYFGRKHQALYNSPCFQAQQIEDCKKQDLSQPEFSWYSYFVNPVGKFYAKILLPKLGGVVEKMYAINGQIQEYAAKLD
jgi:hypothetical protein